MLVRQARAAVMDLAYFLHEPTALIRHFYDTASVPFMQTKRQTEASERPFGDLPWDDGRG